MAEDEIVQIKIRARAGLREELEHAAKARGTSMNADMIDRLERSLHSDTARDDEPISEELAGLLRVIGRVMEQVGRTAGFGSAYDLRTGSAAWLDSPYAYDQVVRAVNEVFEALRPQGEIEIPSADNDMPEYYSTLGSGYANGFLSAASIDVDTKGRSKVRADLGRLAERLGRSPGSKERRK